MRFVWDNLKNESQIVSPCATQIVGRETDQVLDTFKERTNNTLVIAVCFKL